MNLSSIFHHGGNMSHPMQLIQMSPIPVVMLRHVGSYDDVGPVFDQLWNWLQQHNIPTLRTIGIYWDDPDEVPANQLRSAACFEISPGYEIADRTGLPIEVTEIAGGPYVTTRFVGPYEKLAPVWNDLSNSARTRSNARLARIRHSRFTSTMRAKPHRISSSPNSTCPSSRKADEGFDSLDLFAQVRPDAIIGPPVAITIVVLIWGSKLATISEPPIWLWVFLVLGIDVAHVYSSLFRTYFDKDEFKKRKTLYLVVPAICWIGGIALYAFFGPTLFWSAVAYFAIYHFVRQQYGFLMLYRRGEPTGTLSYRIDQIAIYMATIYPLVYWHTYTRNFQWFSDFEVIHIPVVWPEYVCRAIYILSIGAFLFKEVYRWRETGSLNLGNTLLLVTAAAWGTGIILFNGDLTFTLINVISHGIPYMALIWIYQYRKRSNTANAGNRFLRFFQIKYIPLYALAVFAFAYFEEGIWDRLVWDEHSNVFGSFYLPASATLLIILVPLLTMPQLTHYVLDAFIWRVNKKGQEEVRAVIG